MASSGSTDFGLAKAEDDGLTQTGDVLGTIRYMAPERFSGQADPRSDVYALGLTLYELLVLRPAFDSPNRLALIDLVKNVDPPRPRSIDPRIPLDLETIVLKAVEKDPKARYASADVLGEDLRRFLADEPIQARQVSTAERYWRWARRNPVIASLGGAVTALLVAVATGSLVAAAYFKDSARRESELASREQLARRQAIIERDHSRQQSASLSLDKGIALAEEGHADRGLLWMLEALKTAPEDAEGFRKMVRWNLGAWLGQVHKTLRIIDTGPCTQVAFSPDGKSFATGVRVFDQATATPINLWNTASGRRLRFLPDTVSPVAFRPDGTFLVATSTDRRRLLAIDPATGHMLWRTPRLSQDKEVVGLISFSPDGSTVLAQFEDKSGPWSFQLDAVTGRQRGEPMRSREATAVAPDGRMVAARRLENGEAYIDVLEVPSGRRTASWRIGRHDFAPSLFSPDGESLFVVFTQRDDLTGHRQFGQIFDADTGRQIGPLMAETRVAIYTPAADRLVTWTGNSQLVLDASDGRVKGSGFPADLAAHSSIAVHPDGRTVLAAASDNTVRLWQVSADAESVSDRGSDRQASMTRSVPNPKTRDFRAFPVGLWAHGQIAVSLANSAAGRELIRTTDSAIGLPFGRPAPHGAGWIVRASAFSPDGPTFATGSHPDGRVAGEVRLWEANTGRLRFPPMPHTNYVAALAFQPDGKVLAAGDFSGLVRLWDTSTGREIGRPLPQGEIILSLAYSPDGQMLAVGISDDHTRKAGVRLWDTRTRQPIGELLPSTRRVTRIEFRPDGRALLAGNGDDLHSPTTRLWDVTSGQAIGEPMLDEGSRGFHPDGRAFLTVARDGMVRLRDAATGAVLTSLLISTSPATSAAFRGDGGLVVAGFADGTVRLCDPATSQPVGPPRSMRHAVHQVAFMPDGRMVAAIDEVGESRTWPVPEPLPDSDLDDLTLRIEARTGLRMETGQAISRLDAAAWRDRLDRLGRLDPAAVRRDDDLAWHEPMIREAEQNGHAFAALWHLDRLIAARTDDWYLYARRARAWSRSDRFDKAAADYRQAERLCSRDQILDFQAHCVLDCTEAGRWAEALWYLDRLIAARPNDGMLHEDRAAVYGQLGREADRQAELTRIFELGADEGLVIPKAEELGRAGRWAEAAGLLARCGRSGPLSRELAQAWAIACLTADDRAGYREACAAFMAWRGPNPNVVWNELSAASLFALGAGGLDDYQVPLGWLERRLSSVPTPRPLYRHLFSNALGGLLLRAGRIDEAIARLNQGMAAALEAKDGESPGDWAYLAVALRAKGNLAEARRWLDRLRGLQPDSHSTFWDLEELAVLRREAESLLLDAGFPSDPFEGPGPR